jgi:hypothetical protein
VNVEYVHTHTPGATPLQAPVALDPTPPSSRCESGAHGTVHDLPVGSVPQLLLTVISCRSTSSSAPTRSRRAS